MSLRFDATLKDMAQVSPRGLLSTFDVPPTLPVVMLNVDLSTVTTAADVVLGIGEPLREIVHFDFQASASASKPADVLVYNALLHRQYHVPVHSILVLLRPQAAHAKANGTVAYAARPGRGKMNFDYEPIRLWERPALDLLSGDIGTVPLATLGQLPDGVDLETGMSGVVKQVINRLVREAPPDQVRRLLTASFVLTGLRVSNQLGIQLFQGVRAMRESTTYMGILEEGQEKGQREEARKLILRLGKKSLGVPNESVTSALAVITNLERLERFVDCIGDVKSWQELLATP